MQTRPPDGVRSAAELRRHYDVERELAERLRSSERSERGRLYAAVYDELFRRVPDHPQLRRRDGEERERQVERELRLLRPFLRHRPTFLEIGAGDCALSIAVAPAVTHAYAVDVSAEITKAAELPDNVELVLSDGTSIPVEAGSVDVAYSNQLMEHLHPDDAREQLEGVFRALSPGGTYVCLTPNRLSGPHDVSMHFDDEARGLHLREYTTAELVDLFRSVGFDSVTVPVVARRRLVSVPASVVTAAERTLAGLPPGTRRAAARSKPFRKVLGKIVARKSR